MILSSPELIRRCEEADVVFSIGFAETLRRLRPDSQAEALHTGGGCCVFAGPGSPLNKATGLGMNGPVSAEEFTRVEEFFLARDEAPHIDFCTLAHSSLLAHINERNYYVHSFTNTLVRPSGNLPPLHAPAGVTVRKPAPGEADIWMDTLCRGFMETGPIPPIFDDIALVDFHHPAALRFFAEVDGVPAGAGCLALADGTATFFGTSTLAAFRRRGVQTALLHHRLHRAAAEGCDLVRVITTPGSGSERNIGRCGFTMAYARVRFARRLPS